MATGNLKFDLVMLVVLGGLFWLATDLTIHRNDGPRLEAGPDRADLVLAVDDYVRD